MTAIDWTTGLPIVEDTDTPSRVDDFDRLSTQAVTPDGKPVENWYDLFVMLPWEVVGTLSGEHQVTLATLYRLRDNLHKDICKRVTTLEETTGLKRLTLYRQLSADTRPANKQDGRRGALVNYAKLRTEVTGVSLGPSGEPDDLIPDESHAHVWYGSDGEPRWRIDLVEIDPKVHRFVKIYYHWLWEDPATTGGDTWVPKRYPSECTNNKGETVTRDVRAFALKGALTVAACATREFRRGQAYGISGLATVANLSTTAMVVCLNHAEDHGLIGVANRKGRHKSLRWVRWGADDPVSPEPRVKRSHGPSKEINAEVMESRRLARESAAAAAAAEADAATEAEEVVTAWIQSLPDDEVVPMYAYAEEQPA